MNYIMYGHINVTDVKSGNNKFFFQDIYANEFETKKFGKEKIYRLTFEQHKNQEIDKEEVEYWGWLNNDGELIIVYANYFLFEQCFRDLIEKHNRGKKIKLELTNFTNHYNL